MDRMFEGRTALVTGAGRPGIGAACVRRLAESGGRVVFTYHAREQAALALAEGLGDQALAVQADLSRPADIQAVVAAIADRFGRLDILVNNAAVVVPGRLEDVTAEQVDETFSLNVRAPLLLMQALTPLMPPGSAVVNISSINGRRPVPNAALYSASKAALDALTVSLAAELGPRGIRVNAVAPGLTGTERRLASLSADDERSVIEGTPLGRLGAPADIADVVAFLCSDNARWITGEIIGVSGGFGLA